MKKKLTYLFILFFVTLNGFSQNKSYTLSKLEKLSMEAIEKLPFDDASVQELDNLYKIASQLLSDSLKTQQHKGELLLAVMADNIGERIKNNSINPKKENVRKLLKKFETQQYFIYQPKINDFIKLMHYLCQGKYSYIYSRFSVSGFFIPSLLIGGIFILLVVANFFGKIKWRYRKKFNKLILIGFAFLILLLIIFKFTCHDCVQEYSFYGIPF